MSSKARSRPQPTRPNGGAESANPWPVRLARKVLRLAVIVAATLLGCIVLLTLLQSRVMYHPRSAIEETPADWNLDYQDVWMTTADGVRIHGWYVPSQIKPRRGAMLFLHGNGGNISRRCPSLELYSQMGLDVLILDYRGYGRSEGKPTEAGTYEDALAGWAELTGPRAIPPERIVIFGRSLGGAVATWLATQHTPAGLIVESSFTSAPDMARALFPLLPRWLCRFGYNSIDRIGQVACPVLIVHSCDDDLVPYEHGRALYEAAASPKTFVEIHGSHNEGFLESMATYQPAVDAFLDSVLGQ